MRKFEQKYNHAENISLTAVHDLKETVHSVDVLIGKAVPFYDW